MEAGPENGLAPLGRGLGGAGLRAPWVEPRFKEAYSQLKVEHRPGIHQQRPAEGECDYLGRPRPFRPSRPSLWSP